MNKFILGYNSFVDIGESDEMKFTTIEFSLLICFKYTGALSVPPYGNRKLDE